MLGRPKKEDSREKQYRVRLNDKEDEMLAFASNATGVPKSEIFRKALQEYCEKVKLQQAAEEIGDNTSWMTALVYSALLNVPIAKRKIALTWKMKELFLLPNGRWVMR